MFSEDPLVAEAQKIMLQILCEVDKICTEHKITYWLEGGTLLGAVRHRGFIPWDDDIDIAMPRKDYERFLTIAPQQLPVGLFLQTRTCDPHYNLPIAKVRKKGTLLIEEGETGNEEYCHGIFIDIIPNDYYESAWFIYWMRWARTFRDKKKKFPKGSLRRVLTILYTNILLYLPVKLSLMLHNYFVKRREWFQNENASYLSHGLEFGHPHPTRTADILPPAREKEIFEGHDFFVPRNKEQYLTDYYDRDYMVPPPVGKRKIHAKKIII